MVQTVDVFSGLGGALGLWLGWSGITIGLSAVQALKTLRSFDILK